jgi:hypothetical protein
MNTNVDIIMQAILRGDSNISLEFGSIQVQIPLPTPQRAGTHTQQSAYARMKAREMAENAEKALLTNQIKFSQV